MKRWKGMPFSASGNSSLPCDNGRLDDPIGPSSVLDEGRARASKRRQISRPPSPRNSALRRSSRVLFQVEMHKSRPLALLCTGHRSLSFNGRGAVHKRRLERTDWQAPSRGPCRAARSSRTLSMADVPVSVGLPRRRPEKDDWTLGSMLCGSRCSAVNGHDTLQN